MWFNVYSYSCPRRLQTQRNTHVGVWKLVKKHGLSSRLKTSLLTGGHYFIWFRSFLSSRRLKLRTRRNCYRNYQTPIDCKMLLVWQEMNLINLKCLKCCDQRNVHLLANLDKTLIHSPPKYHDYVKIWLTIVVWCTFSWNSLLLILRMFPCI